MGETGKGFWKRSLGTCEALGSECGMFQELTGEGDGCIRVGAYDQARAGLLEDLLSSADSKD